MPPRKLNGEIPPWLQEIILRCLEVHAGRRYPSAAQLALDLRNPDQVALTARAAKMETQGLFATLRRKSEPERSLIDIPVDKVPSAADAPIIAVAIDLDGAPEELSATLRRTILRILERTPEARLACLNVLKLARLTLDRTLDDDGNNKHVARLVRLKDWAHPLNLPPGKVTFHVLEAVDPAESILDYARENTVDHIVMGARENSTMRKLLGSVSARVAAEAPCTVTVVRNRSYEAEPSS